MPDRRKQAEPAPKSALEEALSHRCPPPPETEGPG
jgi:hypothetical protein